VALHPRSQAAGRFSTNPEHMPSNHRFVLELNADWLLRQAQTVGPQTTQYLTALLHARAFPEQAYRSCLGVLSLARKYPHTLLEKACQTLLDAHLFSYRDLKGELERLLHSSTSDHPATAHENIRGETYYR
jgi:hypothetical protein